MGFWGNLFSRIRKALMPVTRFIKRSIEYCVNKLADAGRAIIQFYKNHPFLGTALIIGGLLVIVAPLAIGFFTAGVAAGSLAAAWQASIGLVEAGSLFASMQSLAATGAFLTAGSTMVATGAIAMAK